MIELTWELLPVLLGLVASPLAIIALVAVLLSRGARRNGVMFLLGWAIAVTVTVIAAYLLLDLVAVNAHRDPPLWVPIARLVLGVLLAVGAVWTYRRSRAAITAMAAARTAEDVTEAAPQLPGWLHAVESFSPGRSLALGLGIFLLNPINLSCAFVAALDIRLAGLDSPAPEVFLAAFIVLGIAPMSIPVLIVLLQGHRAAPVLKRIRGWIAEHNGTISAALLAVVAFLQVQKALAALPWF